MHAEHHLHVQLTEQCVCLVSVGDTQLLAAWDIMHACACGVWVASVCGAHCCLLIVAAAAPAGCWRACAAALVTSNACDVPCFVKQCVLLERMYSMHARIADRRHQHSCCLVKTAEQRSCPVAEATACTSLWFDALRCAKSCLSNDARVYSAYHGSITPDYGVVGGHGSDPWAERLVRCPAVPNVTPEDTSLMLYI